MQDQDKPSEVMTYTEDAKREIAELLLHFAISLKHEDLECEACTFFGVPVNTTPLQLQGDNFMIIMNVYGKAQTTVEGQLVASQVIDNIREHLPEVLEDLERQKEESGD